MGWKETCAVDERMRFVMMVAQQEESFAGLCRRFGVSRKIGYKWWARYQTEGAEGLMDRSRARSIIRRRSRRRSPSGA
jgi:putative transposase